MGKLLEINHCRKQFGGINGDLAGFFVCTGEACCAVCVAVCLMAEEIWIL